MARQGTTESGWEGSYGKKPRKKKHLSKKREKTRVLHSFAKKSSRTTNQKGKPAAAARPTARRMDTLLLFLSLDLSRTTREEGKGTASEVKETAEILTNSLAHSLSIQFRRVPPPPPPPVFESPKLFFPRSGPKFKTLPLRVEEERGIGAAGAGLEGNVTKASWRRTMFESGELEGARRRRRRTSLFFFGDEKNQSVSAATRLSLPFLSFLLSLFHSLFLFHRQDGP